MNVSTAKAPVGDHMIDVGWVQRVAERPSSFSYAPLHLDIARPGCPLGSPIMKRLRLALAIVGMASTAMPLEAQSAHLQFGMGAGMAFPAGKFHSSLRGEGFGSGLQGMAFALFKIHPIPTWLRL